MTDIDSWPQKPREDLLFEMETRDIEFPNGRVIRMTMSLWHWLMRDFCDEWKESVDCPQGILWHMLQVAPNTTDSEFTSAAMVELRHLYEDRQKAKIKWVRSSECR